MSTVEAPIVAVTVYPQQARVTRRGRVSLEAGPRMTFAGLPLGLDPRSVRVAGNGPALITGVDVHTERHAEPADAALGALVGERRMAQAMIDAVSDDEAAEAMKVELLTSVVRRTGSSFAKALAAGTVDPDRVAEVSDALGSRLAEALKARRRLTDRLARLREDLAALDRRIEAHSERSEEDSTSVVVELEITDPAGEAELELSYVVNGASWEPGYDIRVRGTDVTVMSYGLVSQHTGEDWPECELALSTARPANMVVVPELRPWYLDRAEPVRPMAPAAPAAPGNAPDRGVQRRSMPLAMAPKFAAVEQGMTAVTYRPSRPVGVPSGAQGHRTTLARLDLTAELGYITAPVLAQEAYLRAKVVNTPTSTHCGLGARRFSTTPSSSALPGWTPGRRGRTSNSRSASTTGSG